MKRFPFQPLTPVGLFSCALWFACGSPPATESQAPAVPVGQPIEIAAPLGLPPVPILPDNPPTAETIALGRQLFYDPLLSSDETVACANCHHPDFGFADPKPLSEGVKGQLGTRHAPTVWNAAYSTTQFWDGRAASLEEQAAGPIENPVEMAHTLDGAAQRLSQEPSYVEQFERAWGAGPITPEKITMSIASFERTVISGNSPFDRYFYGGEQDALSGEAKLGLEVFRDPERGNCAVCHEIGEDYALFTDNKFHNLGAGASLQGEFADWGRFEVTGNDADRGAFKTPTLRNIALTAPYLHDGSLRTLKEVVDFYIGAGNSNPWRDKEIRELSHLTREERDALVAFMESLTGEIPPGIGPPVRDKALTGMEETLDLRKSN